MLPSSGVLRIVRMPALCSLCALIATFIITIDTRRASPDNRRMNTTHSSRINRRVREFGTARYRAGIVTQTTIESVRVIWDDGAHTWHTFSEVRFSD